MTRCPWKGLTPYRSPNLALLHCQGPSSLCPLVMAGDWERHLVLPGVAVASKDPAPAQTPRTLVWYLLSWCFCSAS